MCHVHMVCGWVGCIHGVHVVGGLCGMYSCVCIYGVYGIQ